MAVAAWTQHDSRYRILRWREFAAVALIWLGAAIVADGATMRAITAAVLLGVITVAPLTAPLRSGDRSIINTATARRVAGATLLTALAGVAAQQVGLWSLHPVVHIALACASWMILAVTTRVHPLSVETGAPSKTMYAYLAPGDHGSTRASKRIVDIVVSGVALVLASPVLAATMLAVRLHDGGPAFFRQRRLAFRSGTFEMLKFRSMVLDAEARLAELKASNERSGPLFKMTNDPRITPVGRIIREFSIDELPQLLNIFRGDMSIVGPRPALPHEAEEFDSLLRQRTLVKPGLTGLWQAEARNDPDFERFRELDLRYLYTASPALDACIILATATEVVTAIAAKPLRKLGIEIAGVDGIADAVPETTGAVVIDLRDHAEEAVEHPLADRPHADADAS